MNWKIFYGDGSTFSDQDGLCRDAPATNIQVIAQANPTVGRELLSGKDFYFQLRGEWIGTDLPGLLDHLMEDGCLKCGRTLTRLEWDAVLRQAMTDTDLPKKSAKFPGERA